MTAKDIREGERGDCSNCPIARATARAVKRVIGKSADHVTVAASIVAHVITGRDGWINHWWMDTPRINHFIREFDAGNDVKPTSFVLNPGAMPAFATPV